MFGLCLVVTIGRALVLIQVRARKIRRSVMRSRSRFAADVWKVVFCWGSDYETCACLDTSETREIWIALRFFLAENSTETVGGDFGKSLGCGCRTCACLDTSGTASNKKAMPVF